MNGLLAKKSEDVGLIAQLVSKIFHLCGHDPPTSQTDGRTDKTALCTVVHRAVKTTKHNHWSVVKAFMCSTDETVMEVLMKKETNHKNNRIGLT